VAIGHGDAQPPFPIIRMNDDPSAVHLTSRGEARSDWMELVDERVPAPHHLRHRLRSVHAVRAGGPGGGERANAERSEVVDDFAHDVSRHDAPRRA
jgi:hypothetical protein